jgi:outer membrane protein assembly factor BamB
MHQTDGATLYCMDIDKGLPIWQLPVPGTLVHLEGSPTVDAGKAYIGGGAAGVLCVDINKITLEGKAMDLATVQKVLAKMWKEKLDKYEIDKKKDPCFAVPPSPEDLPRANPTRLWQQGKEKWHVDAPVNVAGDKVLVCSAFLNVEKTGDSALICLSAETGEIQWRTPLKLNPWGGASVMGKQVIVTGSSIGYYPNQLKGARGFIACYNLADGKEQWYKEIVSPSAKGGSSVTGGVVACAALADGAAVITATDGKVRAFELETGERRWVYDSKIPYFAPVAVAGNTVYAGDFKGAIHAIDLKSGNQKWVLDLGSAPETQSPGMVYGGPTVHQGRVYVATCNLEGSYARQPTVVVCIGEK